MAVTEVITYNDLVNRMLDGPFGQLARDGRNARLAKRATLRAYRDLPAMYRWSYFERTGSFTTTAPQTTGTIAYDHTGHASGERIATISGATWPANAYDYQLIVGTSTYEITRYISTTLVQLAEADNPGEDIAAGTAYTLARTRYPAPVLMRRCSDPVELATGQCLEPLLPNDAVQNLVTSYTPQREICYSLRGGYGTGKLYFELSPPPNSERHYNYVYELAPRPLETELANAGTVTVAAGSTTVTGTSTAFADKHVGSILRFSSNGTNYPTPPEGDLVADNPYVAQRTILSVASTTSLTIDSAVSAATTYTDVKYTISDPLDVEPFAMLSALERLTVAYLAEDLDRRPAQERLNWKAMFERDLIRAKIADNTQRDAVGPVVDRRFWNLRDWLITESYGGSVIT